MIKTLAKHGNSYALVIDKPILDLLKITPETPLEVTTDGESLTIRRQVADGAVFDDAVAWAHAHYDKAFKRLAN